MHLPMSPDSQDDQLLGSLCPACLGTGLEADCEGRVLCHCCGGSGRLWDEETDRVAALSDGDLL
jgi:hypothetical protein